MLVTLCHACYLLTRRAEVRHWTSLFSHCACFRPSLLEGLRFDVRLVSVICPLLAKTGLMGLQQERSTRRAEILGDFVA